MAKIPEIVSLKNAERPETADYRRPVDKKSCALLSVAEYLQMVAAGELIDYDGMGYPVRDGMYAEPWSCDLEGWPEWIKPSDGDRLIPNDATHVLWFNR